MKKCYQTGRDRTCNLLITSWVHIWLSHRGRPVGTYQQRLTKITAIAPDNVVIFFCCCCFVVVVVVFNQKLCFFCWCFFLILKKKKKKKKCWVLNWKSFVKHLKWVPTQHVHYENMPIQIYWKFYNKKKGKFSDKKFWYVSYFCSKHRLWILVRTASNEYPQSIFWAEIRK